MTAVTVSRDDKQSAGDMQEGVVAASTKIPAGCIVAINTSGFAVNGADTASFLFGGVAADTVDNSAGAAGDEKIALYIEGTFEFAFSGTASQADFGKSVYIVDNATVGLAATTTNDVLVGKICEFVSASKVRVKI